jgi:hypothetical protein
MRTPSYCTVSECDDESREGRRFCEFHEKRHQRCTCSSAARCQCLTAPKAVRLSPRERLLEAAHRLADADAEDDAAYAKSASDLLKAAKQCGPAAHGEAVRQGMAAARARGVRLGRRPSVTLEQAREAVSRCGSIVAAARALGRDRDTVSAALRRAEECRFLPQPVAA